MSPATRTKRHTLAQRSTATRAARRAHRALATGQPQPARVHLTAAGLDDTTAHRYAGAFSRGVTPTATTETKIKLKGRRTKRVTVKLYSRRAFAARLAVYRPKNPTAAAAFATLAA